MHEMIVPVVCTIVWTIFFSYMIQECLMLSSRIYTVMIVLLMIKLLFTNFSFLLNFFYFVP